MSECLETLYILGVLKNPVIGFSREREILVNTDYYVHS